jgi:hypothetical protein
MKLHLYLLDGGGAGLLFYGLFLALLFTLVAILVEATIMTLFKYNPFSRSVGHSAIINIASLIVGFLLIAYSTDIFNLDKISGFIAFYIATILVEFPILYLLNKQKPISKTLLVCIVMNLVTYIILYLFANSGAD